MKKTVCALFILLSLVLTSSAWGVPASPFPISLEQPDGTAIEIFRQGDEFFNWVETSEGYPLVKNETTGFWEYARASEGTLESTGIPYRPQGTVPENVSPRFHPSPEKIATLRQERASENLEIASTWTPRPLSGTRKILAIRVGFLDRPLEVSASNTENAFFGATNSVAKYYQDQSKGTLQVQSALGGASVLTVNLGAGDANGGNHPDGFIDTGDNVTDHRNEVAFVTSVVSKAAAQGVNFASFDTNGDGRITPDELVVYLIVAGYEESGSALTPSVWAHAWSSWTGYGAAHMVTIAGKTLTNWAMNGELYDAGVAMPFGVICHELGHQFCKLPDLYDVNKANEGLGHFSLMAGGSWGREAGAVAGSKPVNLDAWSRYYLGWETPLTPPGGGSALEASSSTVTFGTPYNGTHPAVRLASSSHRNTEFFLAEVRALSGWDAGLEGLSNFRDEIWPGAGILILHVDETIGSGSLENGNDFNAYVAGQNQGCMAVEANGVNMAKTDGNADRGAPYTLWYSENPNYVGNGTFTPTSNPNSNFYGGTSSNIKITNISASGATMTATVETDEPAPTPTTTPPTTTPIPTPGSGGGGGGGCSALGFAPLGLLLLLPFLALKK